MAWDFETEPEFEAKLEWIRQFVREKVEPLAAKGRDPDKGAGTEPHLSAS